MAEHEHLAMAYVPVQHWGKTYDEKQALLLGTIFPELNKPFYVTEEKGTAKGSCCEDNPTQESAMLEQIQQISFVLDDLRLFLDTHPENKDGLKLFREYALKRRNLLTGFAVKYYPLTPDCMAGLCEEEKHLNWCWTSGPAPWEGCSGNNSTLFGEGNRTDNSSLSSKKNGGKGACEYVDL